MNKKLKALLSLLLVFMMLVTSIYLPEKSVMASTDSAWADASTVFPNGEPYQNRKGFRVNMKLYREKHIIVYGDYSVVPNNDYKEVDDGYYEGGYGEYRYHGFLYDGSPYVNADFPVDSGMTHPFDYYFYMNIDEWGSKSDYNIKAIGNDNIPTEETITTQKTIKDILINSHFNTSGIVPHNASHSSSVNAWDYANVLTYPSENTKGTVMFKHKRTDLPSTSSDYNSVWYLSLETEPFQPDKILPTNKDGGLVASLTGSLDLTTIEADKDYTIELTIGGDLDDIISEGKDPKLYYTGQDIKSWNYVLTNTVSGEEKVGTAPANGTRHMNKATQIMTISSDYIKERSEITTESGKIDLGDMFSVTVYANFSGTNGPKEVHDTATYNPSVPTPIIVSPEPEPKPIPDLKEIEVDIEAPNDMLDTEKFHIIDNTDRTNVVSIDVSIDGNKLSESDENTFLNGDYLFPLIGKADLYNYEIIFYNALGVSYTYNNYVIVHSTKPYSNVTVEGKFKENRKLVAIDKSGGNTNDPYLMARATLVTDNFDIVGSGVYVDTSNTSNITFLVKQHDSLVKAVLDQHILIDSQYVERYDVPSSYHKTSSNYDFYVLEDYSPCIVCNIWNPVLSRNDDLDYSLSIASTDEDTISLETYKIYYDANDDGKPEELLQNGNVSSFTGYTPTKLGTYKIVYYAEEELLGETIEKFITEADKRASTDEYYFDCQNLAPSTQMYIDIPQNFPKVDVMIVNDEDLQESYPAMNADIKANKVNFTNTLTRDSLNPYVYIWDTHTYVYTQDTTRIVEAGRSKPESNSLLSVTADGGYSGTLHLNTSINGDGIISHKHDTTKKVTKVTHGSIKTAIFRIYDADGNFLRWGSQNPSLPSGAYNVKPGPDTSDGDGGSYKITTYDLKKTISIPSHYYIYTAYYTGILSKSVKQEFKPNYRDTSNKYIVYFAKDYINNKADYEAVQARADSSLILVGDESLVSSTTLPKDYFVSRQKDNGVGKSLTEIETEIADIIAKENVEYSGVLALSGEEFNVDFADIDLDGDEVIAEGFQIVHDANYFDNSLGQATNTLAKYNDDGFLLTTVPNVLIKPGKYTYYRKIKDNPTERPGEGESSNIAQIDISVHRKPIAEATLDWTFDNTNGYYKTTWVDLSYDPDFELSDPENEKGIRDRKIKYKEVDDLVWTYEIPDKLDPGEYELEYIVKDNYGVWSDPFTMNFTLTNIPPPQIKAKLKTESSDFSLSSIPASENLLIYDIWTRYPYELQLEVALYDESGTRVSDIIAVNESTGKASKTDQDVYWKDITFNIPATVKSGDYLLKISAVNTEHGDWRSSLDFDVTINTPINLSAEINSEDKECVIKTRKSNTITANSSKYVDDAYAQSKVSAKILGANRELELDELVGKEKNWQYNWYQNLYTAGMYKAEFTATLPSGESETVVLPFELVNNTPPVILTGSRVETAIGDSYIYEADGVVAKIKVDDVDRTYLFVDMKLYDRNNEEKFSDEIKIYPDENGYEEITKKIADDIELGNYKLIVTVKDDFDEIAVMEILFVANDLTISAEVNHTEAWEENRNTWNNAHEDECRTVETYWTDEAHELKAITTEIDKNSSVTCEKVTAYIIDSEHGAFSKQYLTNLEKHADFMDYSENTDNIWFLTHFDSDWTNKWGFNEVEEITYRFTAYYANGRVETENVGILIDQRESYENLHRTW